jgi:hypothetical protein
MASPIIPDFNLFTLTTSQLTALNELGKDEENSHALALLGGVEGVAAQLHVDYVKGNGGRPEDIAIRQAAFGRNVVPDPPFVTWFSLFLGSFDDFVLRILMVAAVVSIIVGSIPQIAEGDTPEEKEKESKLGWIDGFA